MMYTKGCPLYITLLEPRKRLVLLEVRDIFDRRFTEAIAAAIGAFPGPLLNCVAMPGEPKSMQYFRLPDDGVDCTWVAENQGGDLGALNLYNRGMRPILDS